MMAIRGTKMDRLARIVAYAKELGFVTAHEAWWDVDNAESPLESLRDATDGDVGLCEIALGVFLGDSVFAECHEVDDDYPQTIYDEEADAKAAWELSVRQAEDKARVNQTGSL